VDLISQQATAIHNANSIQQQSVTSLRRETTAEYALHVETKQLAFKTIIVLLILMSNQNRF